MVVESCHGCSVQLIPGETVLEQIPIADGQLLLTEYRLLFFILHPWRLWKLPLGLIWKLESYTSLRLKILTKTGLSIVCTFDSEVVYDNCLSLLMRQIDLPIHGSNLFPYRFRAALAARIPDHPFLLSASKLLLNTNESTDRLGPRLVYQEFCRMGFDRSWKISDANREFRICQSYPEYHIVPQDTNDEDIEKMAEFRSNNRFPSVVWRSQNSGAVLLRCGQPCVGLMGYRNKYDERFLTSISEKSRKSCMRKPFKNAATLFIVDARNYRTAQLKRIFGGGYEFADYYGQAHVCFLDLPNLHSVRMSFERFTQLYALESDSGQQWYSSLEKSCWLTYISQLLKGSCEIAVTLEKWGCTVMIHCTDGWDRTSQLSSLAQLLSDPYYRSIEGFSILIEREWLQFGHKFAERCGLGLDSANKQDERSPIFIQWLDCVHQVLQQFPNQFEFNESFLFKLGIHVYSGLFGTFLCNSERERQKENVSSKTCSLWTMLSPRFNSSVINPFYMPPTKDSLLVPDWQLRSLSLWNAFYAAVLLPPGETRTGLVHVNGPIANMCFTELLGLMPNSTTDPSGSIVDNSSGNSTVADHSRTNQLTTCLSELNLPTTDQSSIPDSTLQCKSTQPAALHCKDLSSVLPSVSHELISNRTDAFVDTPPSISSPSSPVEQVTDTIPIRFIDSNPAILPLSSLPEDDNFGSKVLSGFATPPVRSSVNATSSGGSSFDDCFWPSYQASHCASVNSKVCFSSSHQKGGSFSHVDQRYRSTIPPSFSIGYADENEVTVQPTNLPTVQSSAPMRNKMDSGDCMFSMDADYQADFNISNSSCSINRRTTCTKDMSYPQSPSILSTMADRERCPYSTVASPGRLVRADRWFTNSSPEPLTGAISVFQRKELSDPSIYKVHSLPESDGLLIDQLSSHNSSTMRPSLKSSVVVSPTSKEFLSCTSSSPVNMDPHRFVTVEDVRERSSIVSDVDGQFEVIDAVASIHDEQSPSISLNIPNIDLSTWTTRYFDCWTPKSVQTRKPSGPRDDTGFGYNLCIRPDPFHSVGCSHKSTMSHPRLLLPVRSEIHSDDHQLIQLVNLWDDSKGIPGDDSDRSHFRTMSEGNNYVLTASSRSLDYDWDGVPAVFDRITAHWDGYRLNRQRQPSYKTPVEIAASPPFSSQQPLSCVSSTEPQGNADGYTRVHSGSLQPVMMGPEEQLKLKQPPFEPTVLPASLSTTDDQMRNIGTFTSSVCGNEPETITTTLVKAEVSNSLEDLLPVSVPLPLSTPSSTEHNLQPAPLSSVNSDSGDSLSTSFQRGCRYCKQTCHDVHSDFTSYSTNDCLPQGLLDPQLDLSCPYVTSNVRLNGDLCMFPSTTFSYSTCPDNVSANSLLDTPHTSLADTLRQSNECCNSLHRSRLSAAGERIDTQQHAATLLRCREADDDRPASATASDGYAQA